MTATEQALADMLLKVLTASSLTQDVTGKIIRQVPEDILDEASELLASIGV